MFPSRHYHEPLPFKSRDAFLTMADARADVLRSNDLCKKFDFVHWPPTKPSESMATEEHLNELLYGKILGELFKLMRSNCSRRQSHIDRVAVSQLICYTDKLLWVFNHPNICVQLKAAKLLFCNELRVIKLVMELSLSDLDSKDINGKA